VIEHLGSKFSGAQPEGQNHRLAMSKRAISCERQAPIDEPLNNRRFRYSLPAADLHPAAAQHLQIQRVSLLQAVN
ncbi:MAG: hypothetical protein IJJ29_04285, partial [Solobacterium sp.]|nr:hypothetical protein [Solobacterium sp.]